MKQKTYLILTIIILIFIVTFTLQNTGEVNIHLLFWNIQTSLTLLIFALFSLGVVITIFVLTPTIIALKSTLKKDVKIISKLQETDNVYSEKEVENE
ncbi:MAG: LapA family protein [Maribacter sp.]|nr:LapA family protein [Maribacter sp.]